MQRSAEAVSRLLTRPGAHLKPVADGYELRLGRDGRRRPADHLSEADLTAVLGHGSLTRCADGRLVARPKSSPESYPESVSATPLRPRRPEREGGDGLIRLIRAKTFTRIQLLALSQWRNDHEAAASTAHLTLDWSRLGGGGRATAASEAPLYRLRARRRCEEADAALGELAPLARRMGLEDWGLAAAERACGLMPGSGPVHLSRALDRLAVFYCIGK